MMKNYFSAVLCVFFLQSGLTFGADNSQPKITPEEQKQLEAAGAQAAVGLAALIQYFTERGLHKAVAAINEVMTEIGGALQMGPILGPKVQPAVWTRCSDGYQRIVKHRVVYRYHAGGKVERDPYFTVAP